MQRTTTITSQIPKALKIHQVMRKKVGLSAIYKDGISHLQRQGRPFRMAYLLRAVFCSPEYSIRRMDQGKFLNDSKSLSLTRIWQKNKQKLRYKSFWTPAPSKADLPLLVAVATGEYVVELTIGSQIAHLLLDTGSALVWWQCSPCHSCFQQQDLMYRSGYSKSFQPITCASSFCVANTAFRSMCLLETDRCGYLMKYVNGCISMGILATEKVSGGNGKLSHSITFGCGNTNIGSDDGFMGYFSGILGFQHNNFSFPNQIGASKFSFCFVSAESKFDGSYEKESGSAPLYLYEFPTLNKSSTFVVNIEELDTEGHHFVDFRGIKIDGMMIPIDPKYWKRAEGKYGVTVDSGTVGTNFPKAVYDEVRKWFIMSVADDMTPFASYDSDTCFYSPFSTPVDYIPTVSLCLGSNDRELQLRPENIMVSRGNDTYCFAFSHFEYQDVTLLGSHQLQKTRLSYDILGRIIKFTPDDC
ncbi:aspartic proteinase nepenthesin-1-like [Mercurialis annua]|uniref:aspartic proteinase nepenthesin-1-like n=1 Tax=Mercurialis annua TaxID=3986 RepID=UPI00215F3CF5|nr:aspartic proteinase nepenthesin-1-like [Mercurialis annua]